MHRSRLSKGLSAKKTSGPLLLGTGNRKVFKFRRCRFFAERGLCRVQDEDKGDYHIVSTRDFLIRAKGFLDQAKRLTDPVERKELLNMVDAMQLCVKQARFQGDPNMPGVMRQMKHDNRYMGIITSGIPGTEIPSRK